jgi:2-polyprenyl-3-methyl-5-hydroxy-6-metoxy-1,4-benzoquinol methylase
MLDAGGGDGTFTLFLAKTVCAKEVWIADISELAIERARQRGINVVKIDLSSEKIPFPSNNFDLVSAIDLIEHLFDPDHFLNEVHRVLKPKGYFVLTTPNLAFWGNRILLLLGYQPLMSEPSTRFGAGYLFVPRGFKPAGHIRLFTSRALDELLKASGFRIVAKKGLHGDVRNPILRSLNSLLSIRPSLAMGLGVLAEKE